jgi:O-antigen ligase
VSIRQHPFLGIGAGGTYPSLSQIGTSSIVFGRTNFIHDAYVYFALKFGATGLAAVAALLVGLAASLGRAIAEARRGQIEHAGFPAAFLGLCLLSITAPNLVDPHYSLLAGLLAYLAGAHRTHDAPPTTADSPQMATDISSPTAGVPESAG